MSVTVDLQAGTYSQRVEGVGIRDGDIDTRTFNGTLDSIESLEGTIFNDRFLGSSAAYEIYQAGPGADYIDGRGGWDYISLSAETFNYNFPGEAGVIVNHLTGKIRDAWGFTDTFRNIEEVDGTQYADVFIGNALAQYWSGWLGDDQMDGAGGNDTIYSGVGNDTVTGGSGNDTVYGWEGDDSVSGGAGNDVLSVWTGDDTVDGGTEFDIILGGEGDDLLRGGNETGFPGDAISGEAGNDELFGDGGADYLLGGAGNDSLNGGSGDDTLAGDSGQKATGFTGPTQTETLYEAEIVASGNDTLIGGTGFDVADYLLSAKRVNASLRTNTAIGEGSDTFIGIEGLIGSRFSDFLEGDDNNNSLIGGAGNDQMYGLGGDDTIVGSSGVDFTDGGDGHDVVAFDSVLVLLLEATTVSAGVFRLAAILGSTAGTRGDVYLNVEEFFGSIDNDVIELRGGAAIAMDGNLGDDALTGGSGSDALKGGEGKDVVNGGGGNDKLEGDAGDDTINGGDGNDRLYGSAGRDSLFGNDGNDRLDGGTGRDTLTGGNGLDRFEFNSLGPANFDVIADFSVGDKIVLENTVFLSIGTTLAASAFHLGSVAAGTEDRILYDSISGNLYYDQDGTGIKPPQLFAQLSTKPALNATDFLIM